MQSGGESEHGGSVSVQSSMTAGVTVDSGGVSVHGGSVSVQSSMTAGVTVDFGSTSVLGGSVSVQSSMTAGVTVDDSSDVDGVIAADTGIWTRFLVCIIWLGNHPYAIWFWAILGIVCGTLSPFFLLRSGGGLRGCNCDDAQVHVVVSVGADETATWMLFGGIITAMIYIIGYSVRGSDFLRRGDRPWYFSSIGNGVIFMGSLYVGVRHHNTLAGINGFTLLVVSALGFLEITRPVVDYGLLQSFMKMPILICFMRYGFQWNSWLVLPSLLAVYGIIMLPWIQSYRLPPGATQLPNSQVN